MPTALATFPHRQRDFSLCSQPPQALDCSGRSIQRSGRFGPTNGWSARSGLLCFQDLGFVGWGLRKLGEVAAVPHLRLQHPPSPYDCLLALASRFLPQFLGALPADLREVCISSLGLPSQCTTKPVASTTEIYGLTVVKAGSPRSRYQECWFLLRTEREKSVPCLFPRFC